MKNFIIVTLAFVCIYLSFQKPDKEYVPVERVIVKDSISYSERIDTLYLPSDIEVDTAGIIEKYFQELRINREFKDDFLSIKLTDTIRYNTLFSGDLKYTLSAPKTRQYKYGVGAMFNTYSGVGFGVAYNKNRFDYSLFYYPSSKALEFGILYRF